MYIHKINDFDMIVEDRINAKVRIIYFNRKNTLLPNYWDVSYGKHFVEDFVLMLINRTPISFQDDFIKYSKTNNIFPEIVKELNKKKKGGEINDKKNEI